MIRDTFRSVSTYLEAIPAISRYGLWKYIIYSSIISLLVAAAVFWGSRIAGANVSSWLIAWWGWDVSEGIAKTVSSWLTSGLFLLIFWFLFKYIIFIILSPMMSFLSEEVEAQYDGTESYPFSYSKAVKEMIRGLRIALRNIIREVLITILLLALGLIPAFALFSIIGIYMVQAYYAGFGNMDYYLERRMNVRQTVNFVKQRKMAAIGNGSIFLLLLAVPVIGAMLAPFFGALSATLFLLEESDV